MKVPFRKTKDGVTVEVRVEPRSSKKGIAGVMENVLKVKLTAPPVGGEANEQLIEVMSEATGIRKSSIRIVRGHASKKKVVEIRGISDIELQ
jgi:uncharacterized protein (TIGR00251 family)